MEQRIKIVLPERAVVDLRGVQVRVRACSYGLMRRIRAAGEDADALAPVIEEVVASCCEFADDGRPLTVDDVTMEDAARLFSAAVGPADFQRPPASSGTGGSPATPTSTGSRPG